MKTLYLECNSGISGDMTVAALLDLGASETALRDGLKSLGLDGYDINITRVSKSGISACSFDVALHGHEHAHNHHTHDHEHEHDHDHHHEHDRHHRHKHYQEHDHHHEHEHRGIKEINAIIDGSGISEKAKALAKKIFGIVARAEAKVHGLPEEEVHFHEVGAVDSIVDIAGAAICLDELGIERVFSTALSEGRGTVWCGHGLMPVPAPATLEIAAEHKIPLDITDNDGEMVTPTGIAIAAAITESYSPPKAMTVIKTGYGAGKREFKRANLLRASIVEEARPSGTEDVLELSCNIDDMTGEALAYACEILFEAGALDCWLTPAVMKKGRPAYVLSLLTEPGRRDEFTRLLFKHTSTLGVRGGVRERTTMRRTARSARTAYGDLELKDAVFGEIKKTSVEFESAKTLARKHGVPITEIFDMKGKLL